MAEYLIQDTTLDAIADAINTKTGGSSAMTPAEMVTAIVNIPSGGGIFELIGEVTLALSAYTDENTSENIDTGINISNTDYAWGFAIVTCDTPINTTSEWGMSTALWTRYTTNKAVYAVGNAMQRGSATLLESEMVNGAVGGGVYGVWLSNNTENIVITRKCHSTACPLCRAGNYNIKVYALTSL